MSHITGFGVTDRCTLCSKLDYFGRVYETADPNEICKECTWYNPNVKYNISHQFCTIGAQKKTYESISSAPSVGELLEAIKDRAEHMRKHLALLGVVE